MEVMRHVAEMMRADVHTTTRRPGIDSGRWHVGAVLSGGTGRRRWRSGRLQIAQQGRETIIILHAGSMGQCRKIGDHGRHAVLATTLEESDQVSHQMVSAIARASPSRLGRSGGRCR